MVEDVESYRVLWRSLLSNSRDNIHSRRKQLDKSAINICNSQRIQDPERFLYKITYDETTDYIKEFLGSISLNSSTIADDIHNLIISISRASQCLPNCFKLIECRGDLIPNVRLESRQFLIRSLEPYLDNIYEQEVTRYLHSSSYEDTGKCEVILSLCLEAEKLESAPRSIKNSIRKDFSKRNYYLNKAIDIAIGGFPVSNRDFCVTRENQLEFGNLLRKLYKLANILGINAAEYVHDDFLERLLPKGSERYYKFLSGVKLTSSALVHIYRELHSLDEFETFRTEFFKQRHVSPTELGWNAILNAIDLSDTFEEDPYVSHTSLSAKVTETIEPKTILQTDDLTILRTKIEPMRKKLRADFKSQIKDTPKFFEELSKVLTKVLKLYDRSFKNRHMKYEYRGLFNTILSLVLNYTPHLESFIDKWYVPLLIRRIYKYGPAWYEDYDTSESFDSIISRYVPKISSWNIRNIIESMRDPINNPQRLAGTDIECSFIFLNKHKMSFNIQNSGVIWPSANLRKCWEIAAKKALGEERIVDRGSHIHYVELSSPFQSRDDIPDSGLRIRLPLSSASILYCYNDTDRLSIKTLKDRLRITEENDELFLRSLRTLVRAKLLLKEKNLFSINNEYKADEEVSKIGVLIL